MDFIVLFVASTIIYSTLYFFDVVFKTCSHYPYIQFLHYTGFEVGFFHITWFTTSFNRTFQRWGSFRPKILQQWFTMGIWCTVLLLPLSFYFFFQSIFTLIPLFGGNESRGEPIIVPVVPGVNLPMSDIGYYITTICAASVFHEAGHLAAARREDVSVLGVGLFIAFLIPAAFVKLATNQISALSSQRELRILCAGIWHNVILAIAAYLVLILVPILFYPVYDIGKGVVVTHVAENSPIFGKSGVGVGDKLVTINDCEISDVESWQQCLRLAMREPAPGYCVNEDLVHQLDESIPVKHIEGGHVECCDQSHDEHLCFEALEDETPLQILQYSCLPGRPVVAGTSYSCRRPRDCPPGLHCVRPVLSNGTTLLRIQRTDQPVVIFVGRARQVLHTVKISGFIPVFSFLGPEIPEAVSKICKYSVVFSSGFALINAIPCFFSDGNHIIYALLRYIGVRHRKQRLIGFTFNVFGTFLVGLNLLAITWKQVLCVNMTVTFRDALQLLVILTAGTERFIMFSERVLHFPAITDAVFFNENLVCPLMVVRPLIFLLCLLTSSTSLRTGIARTRNSARKTELTTERPVPTAATKSSAQPHTFTVSVKGDFMIGVLFSIHHQPKHKRASNSISCGEIREMYGIQRTEATFLTLDRINSNAAILPNVTLGVEIRDSCWYAPVALRQSIEFIRDAISLTGSKDKCAAEPNAQKTPLIGVIGPGSSSVALQVQNLLQLFELPQIGYSTTSKDLSDKSRFSYFMRVVPSDYYQAQVMVDLVSAQNWTYVSAVNTDENYGQSGIQAFRELAERANVCIAKEDSVLSNAEDDAFERVLLNLERDPNARVVVCFCEGMTVRGLLGASRRLNLTGRFLFIGSDGWADRSDVVDGFEKEAQGSISIRIHSPYVKEFDEYYFGLNPFSNQRNPWFKEFWETKFNCSLPGSSTWKPGRANCTGEEQLRDRYKQEPKLSFVVKATPWHTSHLFNVTFPYGDGENEEIVEFDRKGDPPGRYDIMNFQKLPNGSYDYVHVGDWNNGTVTFQKQLQFAENVADGKVESVCSKPCAPGFYRSFTGGQEQQCCWACVQCDQNEILVDLLTCEPCSPGFWPNPNKTACVKIAIEFTQWTDSEAIVAIAFSVLGFLATIFAGAVFVKYNNTPVVKSSTRELSYLILAGMGLSHATTFPILAQPTTFTCILSRTLPGISFAMIYASLLIKTNRIARILAGSKKRFPTKNLRFMSATSQVLITIALIGLEAGVSTTMLFLEPATPTLELPALGRAVLVCNTSPLGVLAPLAFDFLLIGLCTLYALKTRNVPENFNEAKFIGFAMYTTCVIWIAFIPIYFGSNSKIITMCMCVTLSAMVTLVFLFFPKLYIILLQPERNNRALFTTAKSIRCHIGSRVASAINEKGVPYGREGLRMNQSLPLLDQNKPFWNNRLENNSSDVFGPKVEQRTLSCQTDIELIKFLLKLHANLLEEHPPTENPPPDYDLPPWATLSATALLQTMRARIREESVSEDGNSDSGQLKKITIQLDANSPTSSSARSRVSSPASWSPTTI